MMSFWQTYGKHFSVDVVSTSLWNFDVTQFNFFKGKPKTDSLPNQLRQLVCFVWFFVSFFFSFFFRFLLH